MILAPKVSGIYKITNTVTGNFYIGSAKKVNVRWNSHHYLLRQGKHHSPRLQHEWDKYGSDAFVLEVVQLVNAEDLIDAEQRWLDKTDCLFNVSSVAVSPSHDPTIKEKIGLASKAKGEKWLVNGELLSVSTILERYGIRHNVFYDRLKRGWDVERAATEKPGERYTQSGARVHEYNGNLHTLQELVKFASCSKTALFRRIKSGMSVKEAVEMTADQSEKLRLEKSRKIRWKQNER